jgi:hypothetical protein
MVAASNTAFSVTRTIPTVGASREALDRASARLRALDGAQEAVVIGDSRLRVQYDSSRLGFWEIETQLDEAGIARPNGFWWRTKAEWYRYTDHNSQDNASHVAACCSKPPVKPGEG